MPPVIMRLNLFFILLAYYIPKLTFSFNGDIEIDAKYSLKSDILKYFINTSKNRCETFVFVDIQHNLDSIVVNFAEDNNFEFRPRVLVSLNYRESQRFNITTPFFNVELSETEIVNSFVFGTFRFSGNCLSLLIKSTSSPELIFATTAVINRKISRPHKDYYIFISPIEILQDVASPTQSNIFQNIRFKYGIAIPEYNNSTTEVENTRLINYCAIDSNDLSNLYSRNCPALLNSKHFHVTSTASPSMVRFFNNNDGLQKSNSGAGIYYVIFKTASQMYNFTFEGQYAKFGGASGFKKDGIWYGAVGEVFNNEVDFAICAGITVDRE